MGTLPNEVAVTRVVGTVLADLHDGWDAADSCQLSEVTMPKRYPERKDDSEVTAELEPGD